VDSGGAYLFEFVSHDYSQPVSWVNFERPEAWFEGF